MEREQREKENKKDVEGHMQTSTEVIGCSTGEEKGKDSYFLKVCAQIEW